MFIDSIRFSSRSYFSKLRENISTVFLLFVFSFFIDLTRTYFGRMGDTSQIIHGLAETVGSCFFYALILNNLLGIQKLTILNFFTYLRVNILYSIIYLIGSVVLVLPGLYFLTFFYFAPIIALEGNEVDGYFKKSRVLVKKSPLSVFAIGLSLLILMVLDFWLLSLINEANLSEFYMYLTFFFVNLIIILLDYFLFIATIYQYRELSKQ